MARLLLPLHRSPEAEPIVAVGLFLSVIALVALCAKQGSRVSRKVAGGTWRLDDQPSNCNSQIIAPKSPLSSSKSLLATISNKKISLLSKKKLGDQTIGDADGVDGDGVWQKAILMGEKCQPPDFSGVIYYDQFGKKLPEFPPRSPRYSPAPSFSFPASIPE